MPVRIERIGLRQISGWGVDDIEPDRKLTILVRLRGVVIGRAVADLPRPDLGDDGRRGFAVPVSDLGDIVAALADGNLSVEVQRDPAAISGPLSPPAVTFARHLLSYEVLTSAERLFGAVDLDTFLKRLETIARRDGGGQFAAFCFDLLNYARAYFPAAVRGPAFDELGAELSRAAGMVHSARFYEARIARRAAPPPAGKVRVFAQEVLGEDRFGTYALPADLVRYHDAPAIDFAVPLMITGTRDGAFLLRCGIVGQPAAGVPVTRALGFLVNGFSAADWVVFRRGEKIFVMEKVYRADFEQLRMAIDRGDTLILDQTAEGPPCRPLWVEVLNAGFADLGIPPSQALLLNQNLEFPVAARERGLRATVSCAHFFLKGGSNVVNELYGSETRMLDYMASVLTRRAQSAAPRKYVCMNYTPRWQRWATVLSLLCNGHLGSGFVSFPGARNAKLEVSKPEALSMPRIRDRERYIEHVPELLKLCPLTIDVDARTDTRTSWAYEMPTVAFENSFLHIVTETEMSDGSVRRVTEKILKPLVGLQPFLVVGNPGSLRIMREMGFRTFGGIIDEGYDDIADVPRRFDAVNAEMTRCLDLDIDALRRLTDSIADTLVHNFVHLVRMAPLLFGNAVEARLRAVLAAMANEERRVGETVDEGVA